MFITDAQVHIWTASTPQRPWRPGEKPHRDRPLEADELLQQMQEAGVARAVLIPPFWEGRNDVVLRAARAHPDKLAAMGRLDNDPPPAPGVLANWRREPGMLGLRCTFIRANAVQAFLDADWVWEEAEKAGVPVMLLVSHAMMPLVDRVAARHGRLKLVMSHLGLTAGLKDAEAFRDLHKLLALAKRPNVAVKASALPVYTNDAYPYRALHPHLRRVYDSFGPKRMFWGSDLARLPCTYRQAVTMFTEEMPWLSEEDQRWIMGRGVCEWLGWPLPDGAP
jgi:predicted TIM-barrel fold metal-dependent hydrolase